MYWNQIASERSGRRAAPRQPGKRAASTFARSNSRHEVGRPALGLFCFCKTCCFNLPTTCRKGRSHCCLPWPWSASSESKSGSVFLILVWGEVSCNTKRRDVEGWAGGAGYMVNILPDIFERRQCGRPSVTGGAADDADAVVTPNSCEGTLRSLYRCKSERGTEATVEPRCHDVCDQTNFYIGFSHL